MLFNRRRALPLALLALAGALAAACGATASPEGWPTPLISDGQFVFFPKDGVVASATMDGGQPTAIEWTFPDDNQPAEEDIDIDAVYGIPVEADGALFFAGWEGEVYSIASDTGRLRWTTAGNVDIDGSIVAGLALDGERIFVATTEGRLYALNTADGSPAAGWPEDGLSYPRGIWATPIVRNGTIYIATMEGNVHALSTDDGSPTWETPFEADTGAIPELSLVTDELLFVPTLGKKVYLVDPETGQEAHPPIETDAWVWTTPTVRDSMLYFGDFDGIVRAFDITSGAPVWSASVGHKIKAAPALVGDMLVVADRGPGVTFLDATTGQQQGNRVPLTDAGTVRSSLVAYEGGAFILTTNGKLFRAEPERLAVVQVPIAGAPD